MAASFVSETSDKPIASQELAKAMAARGDLSGKQVESTLTSSS